MTVLDLVTECYQDLTILSTSETLLVTDTDAVIGLSKLTRLLDNWNAERAGVYANTLTTYTLVPNLNPHTIGPSGATFTVTQRPVSVEAANLVLTNVTPAVHLPLEIIRDSTVWAALTVPAVATAIPSYLYYNADWPNGSLFLYTVPTVAYGLELLVRTTLAALTLTSTLSLPPGYRDAITLTLGEMIAAANPTAVPNPVAAAQARARIFANNDELPTLTTNDAGIPSQRGPSGRWFDWRSGLMRP